MIVKTLAALSLISITACFGPALDLSKDLINQLAQESSCAYRPTLQERIQCHPTIAGDIIPITLSSALEEGETTASSWFKDVSVFLHEGYVFGKDNVGYLDIDHTAKRIIVAFHGTDSLSNIMSDLSVSLIRLPHLMASAQKGFAIISDKAHREILVQLKARQGGNHQFSDYEFIYTGHSLGGAVALLAANLMQTSGLPFTQARNQIKVVTFAAPMALSAEQPLDASPIARVNVLRFENPNDLVPKLPGRWLGFRHVGFYSPTLPMSPNDPFRSNGVRLAKDLIFQQLAGKTDDDLDSSWWHEIEQIPHLLQNHLLQGYIENLNYTRLYYGKWSGQEESDSCDPSDIAREISIEQGTSVTCENNQPLDKISCSNHAQYNKRCDGSKCWEPVFGFVQPQPCRLFII